MILSDEDYGYVYRDNPGNFNPMYQIVKVEHIQKPWAVGDVVPAATKVGKDWSGLYEGNNTRIERTMDIPATRVSGVDRKIIWIED